LKPGRPFGGDRFEATFAYKKSERAVKIEAQPRHPFQITAKLSATHMQIVSSEKPGFATPTSAERFPTACKRPGWTDNIVSKM
jgi:hypothetical protein